MELTFAILAIFFWEVLDNLINEGALILTSVLLLNYVIRKKKIKIPNEYFFILILILHFVVCAFMGNADTISFLKQFVGISITMIYYYNIIYYYGITHVMHQYCNIAFIFACYGILQEVLGLINIDILVSFNWLVASMKNEKVLGMFQRCVGFCSEPFYYAMLLLPALYIAFVRIYEKKSDYYDLKKSVIIILAFIFTFSSAGYLGAFLTIWLLSRKNVKKQGINAFTKILIGILTIFILFEGAYNYIPEFTMRIDDTVKALRNISGLSSVNLSSYALISNFNIAYNMFSSTGGIGVGLGSYGTNYELYSGMLNKNLWMYGINREDANSMLLRLFAEIGVFTIIIIFYLVRNRRKTPVQNIDISNAMLALIILKFFRLGNYTFGGTMFFFCMYFLCIKKEREI